MNERVTDEMLMAFVDGELDGAAAEGLRQAIVNDPILAERADRFRMTRDAVRSAYAEIRARPAPESLVASVLGHDTSNVVYLSRRRAIQTALPLAASIAILFGVSGYWYGKQALPDADPLGERAMAQALGATADGEHGVVKLGSQEADFTTLATYKVDAGLCRTFEVSGAELQNMRGVGCKRGADWAVELTVAHAGGGTTYTPASDAATGSIDAFLDALEARPLGEDQGTAPRK